MRPETTSVHFNRWLLVIICGFVALSLAYSIVDPLKLGPDEPAHFIYVRSIATHLKPPPISHIETNSEQSTSSHEGHQPPFYYTLMAIPFALLKLLGAGEVTIWRVLRLFNILIGAFWIYTVYRFCTAYFEKPISKEININDHSHALVVTAFVSLIPNSTYIAGVVNNDILIALLFTWALIPLYTFFITGNMDNKSALHLGIITGLAVLTKAQGLVLIPTLLLAALLVLRRSQYSRIKDSGRILGIVLGTTILIGGWWYAGCWITYGSLMPHSLYNPMTKCTIIDILSVPFVFAPLWWLMTWSLIGYFWTPYWLIAHNIFWNPYIYIIMAFTGIIGIGFIARIWKRSDITRRGLCFLLFPVVAIYLSWLQYVLQVDGGANLQGRLLLPVACIIGIVCILGFEGLLRSPKIKKIGMTVGIAAMLVVNGLVTASIISLRWN